MDEMHVINWAEVQVVHSHPHYTQRCTLEASHIRSEENSLKRDVGPRHTILFLKSILTLYSHCHSLHT